MTEILLEAQHLTKIFRRGKASLTAVDDVSFVLKRGSVLGIVGESGSGKSTVAAMLTRLTDVTEGRIFFEGRDVTHVTGPDRRDYYRQIQMVFQDPYGSLNPAKTVGWIVEEPQRSASLKVLSSMTCRSNCSLSERSCSTSMMS